MEPTSTSKLRLLAAAAHLNVRALMSPTRLAEVLQYPPVWLTTGLLCEELVALQAPQVAREYGLSAPTGGTEHWRFGAFRFWLRRKLTLTELESLLEAAVTDPDPPMAG